MLSMNWNLGTSSNLFDLIPQKNLSLSDPNTDSTYQSYANLQSENFI